VIWRAQHGFVRSEFVVLRDDVFYAGGTTMDSAQTELASKRMTAARNVVLLHPAELESTLGSQRSRLQALGATAATASELQPASDG